MKRRHLLAAGLSLPALSVPLAACGQSPRPAQASAPRTEGLDAALTAAAVEAARDLPKMCALIVARDGQPLVEEVLRGPGLDTAVNVKSASKSVLAAVAGAAIGEGLLTGVDQSVAPFLSDRFPSDPDPRLNALTVGHLLSMRAGLASTSGANYGAWVSSRDWVRYVLAQPFESDPGGTLIYSTGTSHLTSAVLTRASGRSTLALTRELLGQPMGLTIPEWPADPQGIYFGGNEMRLSPRALLAFGELYRNDGVHEGVRVLPKGWVDACWEPRGNSRWTGDGHGYGWWMRQARGHEVFYAWGYGGQMIFVVPDLRLTVVMTSDSAPVEARDGHVQALHALLANGFIPAAERGA
ncbi:serine hydrolase [uncultured Brevundimonas sp.]|uniref:serine hydrolase domain-containing protein n=1 Tax=uncultured Brevundimonas sp. TaxID=213418 RepID=UPI0025F53D63|nr:serine hydrolase [uncultured Brevundimonas sp.]